MLLSVDHEGSFLSLLAEAAVAKRGGRLKQEVYPEHTQGPGFGLMSDVLVDVRWEISEAAGLEVVILGRRHLHLSNESQHTTYRPKCFPRSAP